jgi:hypothetical protein
MSAELFGPVCKLPQEVSVAGTACVYKDVIEPLESVSLTILPTKTEKLADLGSPEAVSTYLVASNTYSLP